MSRVSGTFESMHLRNFRLFFVGQAISQCGTWMQTIALGWLVVQLTHNSGVAVGFAIALQFLPTLLFGVWGGVIADRFDKRTVLLCTQVAMAAVAVLLAAIDLSNAVELWMLYAIIVVLGMALAVDNPTRQSFVSELVPAKALPNAIGLSSTFAINSPVVLPLLTRITFGGDADVYSVMTIAMGAGALVGALLVANKGSTRGNLLFVNGMGFGIAICAASVAPTLGLFIGLLVLVGVGQISFLATCNSTLQLTSSPAMRGRVIAVYTIAIIGSTPIGGPIVGWVSEVFGPRWGLAVGGIGTIVGVAVFGTAPLRARRRDQLGTPVAEAEDQMVIGVDGESIAATVS